MPGGGQFNQTSRVTKTSPNVSTSTTIVRVEPTPTVINSNLSNVLNNYKSYNYIFTLAVLRPKYLEDPDLYRKSALELTILRSGGKGTGGITPPNSSAVDLAEKLFKTEADNAYENPEAAVAAGKKLAEAKRIYNQAAAVVPGFNDQSPGRFDMFIHNVEIKSMFGFTQESATSLTNDIRFEVTEPYSMSGFLEALHVAAVAAGYPNYLQAVFVLKLEFVGYPDGDDMTRPEYIPNTERFFPFVFGGVEIEATNQGTKYRCTGTPVGERAAFGQSNKLKKPVNMTGSTVGDILKDLMRNVTEQQKNSDAASKDSAASASRFDEYEIVFPVWGPEGWDFSQENDIAKSKIVKELKDSAVYKFPDPAKETKPTAYKTTTGQGRGPTPQQRLSPAAGTNKPQIQFNEGQTISNVITAIIRDSEYTKDLISNLGKKNNNPDDFGYVDYFILRPEVTLKSDYDDVARRNFQKIRYIVHPYKIHYKRIPGFAANQVLETKLKVLSAREYNYMYTGKNVDVLNFKLNLNNLYFEAVPLAMGNTDQPNKKYGAASSNVANVKVTGDKKTDVQNNVMGIPPQYVDTEAGRVQQVGGSGNQRQDDPYSAMARAMHTAVVDSKSSMLNVELEILGDPLYVVTGGVGNYNPKPSDDLKFTKAGEANHLFREILVTINFRNPVDINANGFAQFDPKRVPFSGVYRVQDCVSIFNDGVFKQTLKLMRVPGQVLGDNATETPISNKFRVKAKPEDSPTTPTTVGVDAGRPTEANLLLQQSRGLPSLGLPGALSNFTNALGGLGGSVSGLLNQVSGAVSSGLGKLASAASVFGGAIPNGVDQLASGIRLQSSGITNLAQQVLGSSALVNQVANSVQTNFPVTDAAKSIAGSIVSKASAIVNSVSIPGSGIGAGASVFVNGSSSVIPSPAGTVTAFDIKSLTNQLPTNIQSLSGIAKGLGTTDIANVQSLGSSAASLVGGIGQKISGLTSGIGTDPSAIASQFGINASQLSGLSSNLQSKVLDAVSGIAKTIPGGTNLSQAISEGLVLEYIPKDKFANIPATTPFRTAPPPDVNEVDLESIASKGPQSLARAFGVSDVSKISGSLLPTSDALNILSVAGSSVNNPLASLSKQFNLTDSAAIGGKLLSAGSQLSGLTGVSGSIESQLNQVNSIVGNTLNSGNNLALSVTSQFGSIGSNSSPLKKLLGG